MKHSLSIVLPCYNEAPNIPYILESLSKAIDRDDVEVILVDNGSTDNSPRVLADLLPHYPFARSIRVNENKGYGFGLYCGLKSGTGRFLGWSHADLQTDPHDLLRGLKLLEASVNPNRTFVKGWRRGRPWTDQVFTVGMSIFASLVLLAPLWDINSQPNILPKVLFDKYQQPPNDFSFDLYYYYISLASGLEIKRFNVDFLRRIHGKSNWNVGWQGKIKFICRTIKFIIRLKSKIRYDNTRIA